MEKELAAQAVAQKEEAGAYNNWKLDLFKSEELAGMKRRHVFKILFDFVVISL